MREGTSILAEQVNYKLIEEGGLSTMQENKDFLIDPGIDIRIF